MQFIRQRPGNQRICLSLWWATWTSYWASYWRRTFLTLALGVEELCLPGGLKRRNKNWESKSHWTADKLHLSSRFPACVQWELKPGNGCQEELRCLQIPLRPTWEGDPDRGASLHPPLPFSSLFSWPAPDQGGGRGHRGQTLSSFRICFDSPSCGFHSTNANFDQVVNTCPSLPCPGSHLFVGRLNICENSWTVCHLVTSFSPRVLLRKAFSSLESQLLLPPPLSFPLVLSSAALLVSSRLTPIQPQVPRLLLMFEVSAWVWLGFTGVWWLFGVRFRGISANTVVCFPHHFYSLHFLRIIKTLRESQSSMAVFLLKFSVT